MLGGWGICSKRHLCISCFSGGRGLPSRVGKANHASPLWPQRPYARILGMTSLLTHVSRQWHHIPLFFVESM